jgi:hypothetical protein
MKNEHLYIGRFRQDSWEFLLFVVRVSGEGNISGAVEIRRSGATQGTLASSGVFKTRQQLTTHLKQRACQWARSRFAQEARLEAADHGASFR